MIRRLTTWTALLALTTAGPALADEAPARPKGLIVHEWGTLTAMQGADGVVLEGLHHEEESLPSFVYDRSRNPETYSMVLKKMETPVIYFYTGKTQRVSVRVRFPKGLLTQWYPQVTRYAPALGTEKAPSVALANGRLDWTGITLIPPTDPAARALTPPAVPADHPWRFSRQTDSALIRVPSTRGVQIEKLLFYRGLGGFKLPVVGTQDGHAVKLTNTGMRPLPALMLLQVEGDKARVLPLFGLTPDQTIAPGASVGVIRPSETPYKPLSLMIPRLQRQLATTLEAQGLYGKEALAMVRTWTESWFRTPGLRLLYLLPPSLTEEILPLEVTPKPTSQVRVMVARLELLTPQHEARVEQAIQRLASLRYDHRQQAHKTLFALGRFAEPNLRRVVARTTDLEVRRRARALLEALYPRR